MNSIHTSLARAGFVRATQGRVIGGVCAGLARKYGVDAWAVRAILVLTLVLLPGSQVLLYPVGWLLMPTEEQAARLTGPTFPTSAGPQDSVA
ncbi:PspC domain-containing protein [Mobilicoccus massiliensis]|uniref:PspC domain-containing protein n=1 Tax=Mobilicoccus massiliensis TaxID=1522310 RepID=UPI00059070F4|nr:PspC domain-containing protein [Mobilicoccus massiliensis]